MSFLRRRRYEPPPPVVHVSVSMARQSDPFAAYWRARALNPVYRRSIYLGMDAVGPRYGADDTNVLVVAPSRSVAGKTTSAVIPNVITWMGPVVSTSTKGDAYVASAMVRSALGTVWHYNIDGGRVQRGAKRLCFSFVEACAGDWETTLKVVDQIVGSTAHGATSDNAQFFRDRARTLGAVLFYAAFVLKKGRESWVVKQVRREDTEALSRLMVQLKEKGHAHQADMLLSVVGTDARQRSGIFGTLAAAFKAYESEAVLASTEDHNFHAATFVQGMPFAHNKNLILPPDIEATFDLASQPVGRFDTIYLTASEQEVVAPIVNGFLTFLRIKAAEAYEEAREDYPDTEPPRVLFALDELATMANLPDLPAQLAKGGVGTLTLGIFQTMSQARDRWGHELGMGMLSLFQNIAYYPGSRDKETIELLTYLAGELDRERWTQSDSKTNQFMSPGSTTSGVSQHFDRVSRLPPDVIASGRQDNPYGVLLFPHGSSRHEWLHATPHYMATPWPELIIAEARKVLAARDSYRLSLPFPTLERDGQLHREISREAAMLYWPTKSAWPTAKKIAS
ncbi:type IV secretory system conjugative DNA transfer family protein [Blastococcus sp. VKM Ac-2987]|uniref:type IV secretory system conjugative DNA transfer family protein n=1 Tax=Blastococcus sp. VKM Ac-2987 TaxID=3004141 RepID=UPI0022ABBD85|nr:type IV secretory system conjugative DNA transfer family protein [Blastococcus sp. VKM Ac-2987]MCZ2857442.1 type IV secretory system conjugative DNA transfer family protein [Blastococcus sp. VKM Ac-2987]